MAPGRVAAAAAGPRPDAGEWDRARGAFATVFDDAGAVVGMFEQEKKRIVGLTQALAQVADSFEKLHNTFNDVEGRVKSFESVSGRLGYRTETAFEAIHDCKARTAELANNYLALRADFDAAERRLAHHHDSIRILTEENRALRDSLSAVERDNRLIVNEIARMRSEIALIDKPDEPEGLFAASDADGSRFSPLQAESILRAAGGPQRSPPEAARPDDGRTGNRSDHLITEISESIEFHTSELGWMQVQAENLKARLVAGAAPGHRLASPHPGVGPHADKHRLAAAASRTTSERKLDELQTLSSSYQALVQDLEKSRAALTGRERQPEAPPAPDAIAADMIEPTGALSPDANGGANASKLNGIRSMYEKRTEELKAELLQERRERQLAECSLKVSRTERLQLQRELAKVRATGWRKIAPSAGDEPVPALRA